MGPDNRGRPMRNLCLALLLILLAAGAATARENKPPGSNLIALTSAQLSQLVPPGVELGPQDSSIPAFPLLRGGKIVGYVFSTGTVAPMPGFTGTPIDLAVAINREGEFLDIEILNQKEPVFVDGLGTTPFIEFLNQYRGKSLHQNISVGSVYGNRARQAGDGLVLDGVSKASASVRIANLTILTSARAVAGVPLNGGGRAPPARPRLDVKEILPWDELLSRHLLGHLALDNRTVDQAFAGTRVAHDDTAPQNDPEGRFIDLYFALVSVPQIGESLLGEGGYDRLMGQLQPGGHAILVMADGRFRVSPEDAVRHTVPSRLLLQQFDLPVSLRDADVAFALAPGIPVPEQMQIFEIEQPAGFDPGSPWNLALRVVRQHGAMLPETWSREFTATYALPESLFERPALRPELASQSAWMGIWQARRVDLGLTALLLLTLALAMSAQHSLTRRPLWLDRFRLGFLALTLGFIGWYAQGQLSIVTLLGVVKAARQNFDLGFLLYDPVSLLIWGFVIVTLFVWGRGTFCGWLCPFGALQDFADRLGRWLGLPEFTLTPAWEWWLVRLKYGVLAVLVIGTVLDASLAETLAEVEPFKTSITLGFDREWPFVAYAGLLLAAGMVMFKPYCRFLCPLGAALAAGGRARLLDWIPRRPECGTPCKLCAHRCRYNAIEPQGAIRYDECFQCLDCVKIYDDEGQCVPLVLEVKGRNRVQTARGQAGEV